MTTYLKHFIGIVIGDFGQFCFCFDFTEWYCQNHKINSDTENYLSVWCQTHYDVIDRNNDVSFEGLDVHYHRTRSETSNNICLVDVHYHRTRSETSTNICLADVHYRRTRSETSNTICLDLQNFLYSIFIRDTSIVIKIL
jgi:hypothetical protein